MKDDRTRDGVLPDVLRLGLDLVVCGSAAGEASARSQAYYAGPGNAFWPVLYRIGLTPRQLRPEEYALVPEFGVGLTDMVKDRSGADDRLRPGDDRPDLVLDKIRRFRPRALAFNGKRAARAFFGGRAVEYGLQAKAEGGTAVFVLPSTSGAARRYWDEGVWHKMAVWVRNGR